MRLIDADAVIKAIDNHTNSNLQLDEDITCILEEVPTIEERKAGRWIKVNGKTAINCSACYHCSWSLSFEDTVKRFKFCPNCGAEMEGGTE